MNAYERQQQVIEMVCARFDEHIDQGLGYNRAIDHACLFYGVPRDRLVAILVDAAREGMLRHSACVIDGFVSECSCPDFVPEELCS